MKKFIISLIVLCSFSFAYAYEKTQNDYKQELLDKGWLYGCTPVNWSLVEPERGGFSAAALKGNIEIMELEKKAGLDITSCGKSLLIATIYKDKPESVEFMVKNGYDPNGKGISLTYLNSAIYTKKYDIAKILLENGANPNLQSGSYYPLNEAIKKKNVDLIKTLLMYGAKPNEKTEKLLAKCKNEEILNLFNK